MTNRTIADFAQIKRATAGYLQPEVYAAVYRRAVAAQEGLLIDIGPAQGASSIALGWGLLDSGKRASRVVSIELGQGSKALKDMKDKRTNEAVLRQNLARYEVDRVCTVLIGSVDDVVGQVPEGDVALLCIDADGALDRDFGHFYQRLRAGAPVILDDCECKIDEKLLSRTDEEIDRYLAARRSQSKPGRTLADATPLGKHYTTFRFVQHFVERGLLETVETIGNTFFGRKPERIAASADVSRDELRRIRSEILAEFQARRAGLPA